MYQHFYQKFLAGHKDKIHFAAHSHHFWPDITLEATKQAWMDSAHLSDQKWDHILANIVPQSQKLIAQILKLKNPKQIAFAPNTHELLFRLISCFLEQKKIRVLTTTSEFHSFKRQISRLKEWDKFEVEFIDNEEENFEQNFLNKITPDTDLIFISHVFYNSGKIIGPDFIQQIINTKNKNTTFCLDGYHAFCAIPVDLSTFENKLFYLAGGYKYAQAGEGACFMTIPENCQLRPLNTGWFASFETLERPQERISYAQDGYSFWGATQDLTALYRFNAVWEQFFHKGIDINKINQYIRSLQTLFINNLPIKEYLLSDQLDQLGHFLTLNCQSDQKAQQIHQWLKEQGILTDFRGERLRFGFGLYLTQSEVESVKSILNKDYLIKTLKKY